MGQRPLSRREQEERRKKEDEQAAANVRIRLADVLVLFPLLPDVIFTANNFSQVFKEFVETFQEAPSSVGKVWVKAGTYDAGSRSKWNPYKDLLIVFVITKRKSNIFSPHTEEDNREKGKLYKPQTKHEEKSVDKVNEYVKLVPTSSSSSSSSSASAVNSKKDALKKVKSTEKKKSNLELFKEELRQ